MTQYPPLFPRPAAKTHTARELNESAKRHYLFGAIISTIIALTISSCGKENKIERFPEGTSMLKMMDEDNGGTTLGNSNVYMTSSGNFKNYNLAIVTGLTKK